MGALVIPGRLSSTLLLMLSVLAMSGGCRSGEERGGGETAVPGASDSLLAAGKDAYYGGDYDAADSLFRSLGHRARERGDSAWVSRALTWRGLTARRRGEYGRARRLAARGLRLGVDADLSGEPLFRAYNALGLVAWEEGRLHDADSLYRRARDVAMAAGDSVSLAKAASNLALVQKDLGRFSEARESLELALELARSQGDEFVEGRVLDNLAMLEVQIGDPSLAVEYLETARGIHRRAGDAAGETYLLAQLGVAHAAMGDPGRAIALLDSAAERAREQGDEGELAHDLVQLADLHRSAGRPRRALQLLSDAAAVHRELGLSFDVATDLRTEAEILAELGDLDRAVERAERSLAAYRELGARYEELRGLLLVAALEQRRGRREASLRRLESARGLTQELAVRPARVLLALAEARIAERQGRPARVLRELDPEELDLQRSDYWTTWEFHALRSRAYRDLGRLDAAVAAGRRAVDALERTRGSYAGSRLRTTYLGARLDTYGTLVELLLARGDTAGAFRVADAARGRALLEHLRQARSVGSDSAGRRTALRELSEGHELLSRADSLVRRLEVLERRLAGESDPELEAEAERLAAELRETRSAFEASRERARASDPTGASLLGAGTFDPARLGEVLHAEEALLEFFATSNRLFLFVVRPGPVRSVRAFITETEEGELAGRVRVARDLVARPRAGGARHEAVLEGLHQVLLGPAVEAGALAGTRRLVVATHGALTYLPVAALRDPDTGRYLVEDRSILHVPSAAGLRALRSDARSDPEPGASPRNDSRLVTFVPFPESLPGSAAEAGAARRAFPDAVVYRGPAATEERFRQTLGSGVLVHAATHGVLNAWNPLFSRIELAPDQAPPGTGAAGTAQDGKVEVHELLTLRVRSSLVLLSGCETGVGAAGATGFAPGEDYVTLSRAFLYAGARNVVATLWRVRDDAAAVIAGDFLEALSRTSPPEALAEAQRRALSDAELEAPYFWAGYRVTGRGGVAPVPQERQRVSVMRK